MADTTNHIPQHIAIIMDGNRRWAKEHKLEMIMGHDKGIEIIEVLVEHAVKKQIPYMTFWAFSTENWNRGKIEVNMLMEVFRKFLNGPITKRLIAKGVKLQALGEYTAFPQDIVARIDELIAQSAENDAITINIALNYGGRLELIRAVQKIIADGVDSADIDEKLISHYLYTHDMPDPDFIIRTGGSYRLSGYLPWQSIYSELYFTDTYWPDFDTEEFDKALDEYTNRERRFGK
jgi:undecaprenyl diphosphate synthase